MKEQYRFTIIMAVYNVELFLREAIESVIEQNIGFTHVQLILVDDGSTDASGSICDEYAGKYPENIICLHQQNAGVSTARNTALPYVQGRYVNYLDSDDMLTENTLSAVWSFFTQHEQETDVVAIPIYYFEGRSGPHRLNAKFDQGTRVINLRKEWTSVQLSMSSSFIRREMIEHREFNPMLHYGEDTELLLKILLEKQTIGVVAEAKYMYRLRTRGEPSALQRSLNDVRHYLPKVEHLTEKTITTCKEILGEVPKFIQYALMYDLQWVIRKNKFPQGLLTEVEEKEYLNRLFSVLKNIDNDVILSQQFLSSEQKYFLLHKKEGKDPQRNRTDDDLQLFYSGCCVGNLSESRIDIDFISLSFDSFRIEGAFSFYPLQNLQIRIVLKCNERIIPCESVPEWRKKTIFGEPLIQRHGFRLTIPLLEPDQKYNIRLGIEAENKVTYLPLSFGWYSPVSNVFKKSYYYQNSICMTSTKTEIEIKPCSCLDRAGKEITFLVELVFNRHNHRRKAALMRVLYWMIKPWQRKPIWLVSDRRTRAGDNGEAFFRFIREKHPEIDARFVLQKSSKAYPDLKKLGKIIENGTLQEKLSALLSDFMISSQAEEPYLNPLHQDRDVFRDLMADKHFVFLQHGIIKDDLSSWLMRSNKNFYGFVTSTIPEYRSVLEGHYGYTEKEIWLTGLPRFDRLEKYDAPDLITIMPTWRRFLMQEQDTKSMAYPLVPDFVESDFYQFYNKLLNDHRLLESAKEHGYQLAFLPHPTLQPHINVFNKNEEVLFFGLDTDYNNVYQKSALVVTDYSSAIFDAVYLYRPVIYAQFDQKEFFSGEHIYEKGYFDYERDGFGEVECRYDSTVNRIIEYIENGCQMKQKYRERADRFFAFRDRNNCQRVYEKIMEGRP